MAADFLTSPFDNLLKPVDEQILLHNDLVSSLILGNKIKIHTSEIGIPDLDNVDIALIGVNEYRNSVNYLGDDQNLNEIRQSLYALYPGNWTTVISDLGDLILGEDVTQTYSRLISLLNILNEKKIIPIIIGGSQDLMYANYRAYDDLKKNGKYCKY